MTADSERVVGLFSELNEMTAAERAERIAVIRAETPALAAELESLLAAHDEAGSFLGCLDASRAAELLHGEESITAPERAGPWRLVREIGRGGLGVVYLGERDFGDPGSGSGTGSGSQSGAGFEQRAAVKLIKRGMDSELILKRFRHERRILASLEHPNIAHLVDGGMLDDGRPYFAMEYIEGVPITAWCDRHRAGIGQRLKLFEQVCRAVQYAHARLIVHRDLKPANILVTTGDSGIPPPPARGRGLGRGGGDMTNAPSLSLPRKQGREPVWNDPGVPKLLDFGIAKLLDEEGENGTELTVAGMHAMTPEYAAPEQIRGEPVSAATDVYALGVVLYELLTGHRPFKGDVDTHKSLAKAICDTSPTLPSAAVTGDHAVAEARGSRPKALRRRLHGDLDKVVLMAMAKEPGRRYGSAEALAEDVRRHLEGMPVKARRETVPYRAGRFIYRHRLGVAATAMVMLALAGGLAVALWQADRAGREASRAQAVQRFVVEVFEGADPTRTLGETITARELLDEGARRLREEPLTDAAVRAELADTLARTYLSLGLLDEAVVWSDEAVAGFRRELGDRHRRTALAEMTRAEVDAQRGEIAAARASLDELVSRLRDVFGNDSPEHLRARSGRAALLLHTGEDEQALEEHRTVLAALNRSRGASDVKTLEQAGKVGVALVNLSRYGEAEQILRGTLEQMRDAGIVNSPQGIYLRHQLGSLVDRRGRGSEAIEILEQTLETTDRVLGPRHLRRAFILIELGFLYGQERRMDESEAALTEAIAILEPWGHYDAGSAMRYLGFIYQNREQWDKAFSIHADAETFLREKLGDDHPMTWAAAVTRAYAEAKSGNIADALPDLIEAVAALERLHGSDSGEVRGPKKYLGEVLRMAGRFDEAERLHRWALALERKLFDSEDTIASASTKLHIARDVLASGLPERLPEARQFADQALATLIGIDAGLDRRAVALSVSGRIAAAEGDVERARRELAEAIELFLTLLDEDAPSVVEARRHLESIGNS